MIWLGAVRFICPSHGISYSGSAVAGGPRWFTLTAGKLVLGLSTGSLDSHSIVAGFQEVTSKENQVAVVLTFKA